MKVITNNHIFKLNLANIRIYYGRTLLGETFNKTTKPQVKTTLRISTKNMHNQILIRFNE